MPAGTNSAKRFQIFATRDLSATPKPHAPVRKTTETDDHRVYRMPMK